MTEHLEQSPPIIIVDRWSMTRVGLRTILEEWNFCPVVPVADWNGLAAWHGRAIALLIVGTGQAGDGLDHYVLRIRRNFPGVPVVFLCDRQPALHLALARKLRVNGCLFRQSDECAIRAVVSVALTGDIHYPRVDGAAAGDGPACHDFSVLSTRELAILRLLLRGQRNKEIARGLCLSEKTVSAHKLAALRKLNVKSVLHVRPPDETI
ncbi:DNA-binding NarL/FixJ family response regulator [Kerstersia gyiorum]|uniref:DNA-binding NarL/FixJ family response regulator n=1 Tax=Kerstersia gyiorum TaxID=206506 RepID=A0A4Q7MRX4_9BURK|nr:response regulator transcription factor [Kerstersia gyiorum]KAB0544422.1 response regulator transcription factor [Kerstersia gyiorum]RZS69549.1 DNA-binding NarL/FixJ family response regulator [Kerstersia gyiorum]